MLGPFRGGVSNQILPTKILWTSRRFWLASLDNGRILPPFSFPQSGDSLNSRASKFSRLSRRWTFLKRPLFQTKWCRRYAPIGAVPTTPDPNTSAKVSRYKWEAYHDTNWWCIYYLLPRGGHTFAKKYRDRNGRRIAILFKSIGVRGWCDYPEPSVSQARRSYTPGPRCSTSLGSWKGGVALPSCEGCRG